MTTQTLKPGDMIIVPHTSFYYRHQLVRVVKVGKIMSEVEQWGRDWDATETGWCKPRRRKIEGYRLISPDANPAEVYAALKAAGDKLSVNQNSAISSYYDQLDEIAYGKAGK